MDIKRTAELRISPAVRCSVISLQDFSVAFYHFLIPVERIFYKAFHASTIASVSMSFSI